MFAFEDNEDTHVAMSKVFTIIGAIRSTSDWVTYNAFNGLGYTIGGLAMGLADADVGVTDVPTLRAISARLRTLIELQELYNAVVEEAWLATFNSMDGYILPVSMQRFCESTAPWFMAEIKATLEQAI